MPSIATLDETALQAPCDIRCTTDTGVAGSKIARYLRMRQIVDLEPSITKRYRLYADVRTQQRMDESANRDLS